MLLHRPANSTRAYPGKDDKPRHGGASGRDGGRKCGGRLSCLALSHFSPLTIFSVAIAGGFVGMAAVLAFYPKVADSAGVAFNRPQAGVVMSAASALPLPPPPKLVPQSSEVRTATTEKGNMAAPLLTRFAAFSAPDVASATPMVMQASLMVDEPVSGVAEIQKSPPPEPVDKTFTLKSGAELAAKLIEMGVKKPLAEALADELNRVWPLRKIRRGQKITVTLEQQPDFYGIDVTYPVHLTFSPRSGTQVVVETDDEGQFVARVKRSAKARERVARQEQPYRHVRGRITSSLYASARDKGVPAYIINQMLRALSYRLDLQRQVHRGDTFEILYGKPFSGTSSRYVLHYAALTHNGRRYAFYRYTTPNGKTTYFDRNGRSVRRGLMRTPISGARISSRFGLRRHPVLGYTKMHTGVDFAAGRGTPIHAAGPGIVIHAGWRGGYGRTVMIKHPNGYVTLYAHQSRLAPGIRKGVRVRQGQVIGYVGATGRVTGPHLHYEVRIKGKPVNPLRVRTAINQQLRGKALAQFRKRVARIEAMLDKLPADAQIARK